MNDRMHISNYIARRDAEAQRRNTIDVFLCVSASLRGIKQSVIPTQKKGDLRDAAGYDL